MEEVVKLRESRRGWQSPRLYGFHLPIPPKLSQPVLIPTPDSPVVPLRPVSVASVGTRSAQKQVSIPLMYGFRLAMGMIYFSPLHMNCHLELHALWLYLLSHGFRLRFRQTHRPSSHRATKQSSWSLPPLRMLIILINIR